MQQSLFYRSLILESKLRDHIEIGIGFGEDPVDRCEKTADVSNGRWYMLLPQQAMHPIIALHESFHGHAAFAPQEKDQLDRANSCRTASGRFETDREAVQSTDKVGQSVSRRAGKFD